MREAHPTHPRDWRVSKGLSRVFPVRLDPLSNANAMTRGSTLSLPRVGLRLPGACLLLLAVAALLAMTVGPATAGAAARSPWVGLDSGRLGDYQWEVKAKPGGGAGPGSQGTSSPCLLVGTTWELGPFNYRRSRYRACAGEADHLAPTEPPVIATSVQPASGSSVDMTAVGMIFPRAARRVRITLAGGGRATIPLHRVSPSRAQASSLERFQYAAFAVRGLWCAEQIVSQDATGRTLWDSGTDAYSCSADGSLEPPTFEP